MTSSIASLVANPDAFDELKSTQVLCQPALSTAPSVQHTMKVAGGIIARIKKTGDARQLEMEIDSVCDWAGYQKDTAPFFIPLYVAKEDVSHTGVILASGAGLPNGVEDIPIHKFEGMRIVLMKDLDPAEDGYSTHGEFTSRRMFGRGKETVNQFGIECVPIRKWYFADTMILVQTHMVQPQGVLAPDLTTGFQHGQFVWTVSIAEDINSEVFKVVGSGDNVPVLIEPFPAPGVTLTETDPDYMMFKQAHYVLGSDVDKYPSSDANTGLQSRLASWCSQRAVGFLVIVAIPAILARSYTRAP